MSATDQLQGFEEGRLFERNLVVKRLRFGVEEFELLSKFNKIFEILATEFEIEANAIESGDYWNG